MNAITQAFTFKYRDPVTLNDVFIQRLNQMDKAMNRGSRRQRMQRAIKRFLRRY